MASAVEICNAALDQLGADNITALTDNTKEARLCNRRYALVRDAVLRTHPWNFALARAELAQESDTPAFEWTYQFQLPTDPLCLRVLKCDETDDFKIEGRKLLSDESTATILYVSQVTDPAQFDSLFVECLAARLAAEMAYALAGSLQLQQAMYELYQAKLREARGVDAMEGSPEQITADVLIEARA